MINRTAIILTYKEEAVRYLNEVDPYNSGDMTIEDLNKDGNLFLIQNESIESKEDLENWVLLNFENLFEYELNGWYTDPSLWPTPLTVDLFYKWFQVDYRSMIIDLCEDPLFDDDL
jgi:hypothetical protein